MSAVPNDPQPTGEPPQEPGRLALVTDLSRYAVLVLSLYFVATFVIAAIVRLAHPYELQWLEGGGVDHVARVVSGEPIYVAPSITFVPYVDTPLYYWVSGVIAKVVGIGFLPLRLTSFLASLGCLFLLFRFVERETKDRYAALAAAGFYAATFPIVAEWFDMGRSDALSLFFVLLGAWWLRDAGSARDHALAALAFGAAFFTKQFALIVVLPLCLHCLLTERGVRRAVFPATALGTIALGSLLANWVSDGWFGFYVFELPFRHFTAGVEGLHELVARAPAGFWTDDLARMLPVPVLLALGFGVAVAWTRRLPDVSFYLLFSSGMLAASWSQRLHLGGDANVMMPAYALVALLAGLSLRVLPALAARHGGLDRGRWVAFGVHVLCVVQLASLYYDPGEVMPADVDRAEGARMVALMEQVQGEILSPAHGHLPRLAGKSQSAHTVAIYDVVRAGGSVADALDQHVRETLAGRRFVAIFGPMMGFSGPLSEHFAVSRMGSPAAGLRYPRGAPSGRSRDVYLRRVE